MGAGDSTVNRVALAEDLERAREELHRLLGDAERTDAWRTPTRGTRWTNEQLLFHMVFGYMIVQRLLPLVRVLGRFPNGVSRIYARLLDAATRPFDPINYYGSPRRCPRLQPSPDGHEDESCDRLIATQPCAVN